MTRSIRAVRPTAPRPKPDGTTKKDPPNPLPSKPWPHPTKR